MNITTSDNRDPLLVGKSTDVVVKECAHCHQPFLAKYWDEELDWYIELNLTAYCRCCQPKTEPHKI